MKLLFLGILIMAISCKSGPTDDQMENELNPTLRTSYPGVIASADDGVITLSGTCPDESCKNSSENAARNVKGVKNVVNNIVVSPPQAATPSVEVTGTDSLQTALKTLLSSYQTVQGTVQDGVVTLTGEIKRSQLTTLMQSVQELKPKRVENKLVIK